MDDHINTFLDNSGLSEDNSLTHLLDCDDEYNELQYSIPPSLYYNEQDMITKCKQQVNACNIVSLNCRSINANISMIKIMLNNFCVKNAPIDILCLQETWIEDSDLFDMSLFHVDNYNLLTQNRYASEHGGLAFYIHKSWKYNCVGRTVNSQIWEEMIIDIINPSSNITEFTICNMYRPPQANVYELTSFIDHFHMTLNSYVNYRKTAYVVGDFNINILRFKEKPHFADFLLGNFSSGFLPSITLPTRLSENSSLLDQIYYNNQQPFIFAGILTNHISDHQPILISTKHNRPRPKTKYITIFQTSLAAKENFRQSIESKNIYQRMEKDPLADPNDNYTILENAIDEGMKSHLEPKTVKFNKKHHKLEPWMTHAILNSVNKKNKMYKKLKKTRVTNPNYDARKITFNAFRNVLRKLIKKAKQSYFSYQFNECKSDIKKTWQTISKALHRNVPKDTPNSLIIDGEICDNPHRIANEFNDYFANICSQMHKQTQLVPPQNFEKYLTDKPNSTFDFTPINKDIVQKIIAKLKSSHSCGHDSISNNIIKLINNEISDCLALIVNQCFLTGIFPLKFKIAKVVPIFKKNDKCDTKNYRPISVLPVLSKVIEHVMQEQLMSYFNNNNIFTPQQYGFRPNHSTELAALQLMDKNINLMSHGLTPINLYLDLSKAFDSLEHRVLISKLKFYGIQHKALDLLQSYLTGRTQFVTIDGIKSNVCPINVGIPQGSVIGPLLFNVFINDITQIKTNFDILMYADDTTLVSNLEKFGNLTSPEEVQRVINNDLLQISTWLVDSKLFLNTEKSKLMIFYKHPKKIPNLNITLNDVRIERVNNFNFLGITIDENITWKAHIDKIAIKISRASGMLRKLQHIFPPRILITIYNSLIHSHMLYGLILWGFKSEIIYKLQKRAIRILAFQPYISHTTPQFKQLKILQIHDLYKLQLYKFYFKFTNNLLPAYFESFRPQYTIDAQHNYNLRGNTVRLPQINRTFVEESTKYQYLLLLKHTSAGDLNRANNPSLSEFIRYFKSIFIDNYDPICHIINCYVCSLN